MEVSLLCAWSETGDIAVMMMLCCMSTPAPTHTGRRALLYSRQLTRGYESH